MQEGTGGVSIVGGSSTDVAHKMAVAGSNSDVACHRAMDAQ